MKIEGRIWKEDNWWLVEIPALDLISQGRSKAEAYEMARAVVFDALGDDSLRVTIEKKGVNGFLISTNKCKALIAFMLKRQRMKHGLTVREASERIGSKSPNAFGAYEQGKSTPTMEMLEKLLKALDPSLEPILKIG